MTNKITFALPSKGAIAEPTYRFLESSGLKINKPNPRQYTGTLSAIPNIEILFQRVKDVAYKVADGVAHIGITGLDVVHEYINDDLLIIHDALGYGHCKLLVAVPESWVDVETIIDLAEVAFDFREQKGRNLRIATTFTNSTREFLHRNGISHFTMVKAEGAIEAAPTIGYADIIVDLTQTGTTLRENHLKPIADGEILASQACLIGNRAAIQNHPELLPTIRVLLEHFDAALMGRKYYQIHANMHGQDAAEVAEKITQNTQTQGLLGPTVAPIYSANSNKSDNGRWYSATVTISKKDLLSAVEYIRSIGGQQLIVTPVQYIFLDQSPTYQRLLEQLQ